MASSSKSSLYFIASLLLLSMVVTKAVTALPPPPACKRDIECISYCESIRKGRALCDERTGHCTCLNRVEAHDDLRPFVHHM
ncbi:hypothetical protein LINGRAHAP2_LOCUS33822 [Linum grandiflorum]